MFDQVLRVDQDVVDVVDDKMMEELQEHLIHVPLE